MVFHIRPLSSFEDLEGLDTLQEKIWDFKAAAISPKHVFLAAIKSGGQVLGAFTENHVLVGFALAFRGEYKEKPCLYSHLMGVSPRHRRAGLGYRLKMAQRNFALEQGLENILWTFDPLLAENALLNIHKLGAIANEFATNLYGSLDFEGYSGGFRTDRFTVRWIIDEKVAGHRSRYAGAMPLLSFSDSGTPEPSTTSFREFSGCRTVAIPLNHREMRIQSAQCGLNWQNAFSQACSAPMKEGWSIQGFRILDTYGEYLLVPPLFPIS